MPEVRSLPVKATATAWLYQPLMSAPRAGWPPVTTGAVWSTLIFSWTVTVALPSSALQNSLVPGVSVVKLLSWHPVTAASEGITVQSIATGDRNQPEQSCGAGVHLKVTLGTASALVAPSRITNQARIATAATRRTVVPRPTAACGRAN